jgi:ubiquinone biosynthesis protein UbiJ
MTTAIDTHCETALESPYSRDRADAIEELAGLFPDATAEEERRVLETLRQVAHESSSRSERDLARETLTECFEANPAAAAPVVVETFSNIAENSKFSDERLDAIDRLRACYPDLDERHRETVGKTLADIAGNATYEDERRRARQRLSDISRDERTGSTDKDSADDAVGYLGESLAEHLEQSAHEGSEECLQRAEEVSEFVQENPVDDDAYGSVCEDIDALVEQLQVVPTGDDLDADRQERVERLAGRVERLYTRGE